jgi:TldD protein
VLVAASDGTYARDIRLHQSLGLSLLAADGEHRASLGRRYGTSGLPDDLRQWDADASAADLCASAASMLYADYVEAGQFPVVLANRFGGVIFHEACGHLLETTQVERGITPFADKVGEPIAHEAVTAIDEGLSDGSFGSLSMDDEGMEPQRTVLIEKGVLQGFLSDRAGELRTGHPAPAADAARAMPSPPPAACATPSSPPGPTPRGSDRFGRPRSVLQNHGWGERRPDRPVQLRRG